MRDSYERDTRRAAATGGDVAMGGVPLPPVRGMESIDPLLSSLAIRHGVPSVAGNQPVAGCGGPRRLPGGLAVCRPMDLSRVTASLLRLERQRRLQVAVEQESRRLLDRDADEVPHGPMLPDDPGEAVSAPATVTADPAAAETGRRGRAAEEPGAPSAGSAVSDAVPEEQPQSGGLRENSGAVDERRAFPRHESSCRVSVSRPDAGGTGGLMGGDWQLETARCHGELLDLSRNGAAFMLNEQPADGERLRVRLQNLRNDTSCDMTAHVVRTTREPAGHGWRVYCSFEQNLAFEHVLNFGHALFRSAIV